MRLLKAA